MFKQHSKRNNFKRTLTKRNDLNNYFTKGGSNSILLGRSGGAQFPFLRTPPRAGQGYLALLSQVRATQLSKGYSLAKSKQISKFAIKGNNVLQKNITYGF